MPLWLPLAIAAPFIGSFLGVVVSRDAMFARIAKGRSRCDACGATLTAIDLLPVASWLALRGRCRHCGARLSTFYPAIELLAVAPPVWAAFVQHGWLLLLSSLFGWMLIALAWIDWRSFRLPDSLTLPLLATGLSTSLYFDPAHIVEHVIGAVASFVVFLVLTLSYRRIRGREGLGLGDAKLAGALGGWLSWQGMPTAVLLAALLALTYFSAFRLAGRTMGNTTRIPFGPFLVTGGWIVWLYGPLIPG